MNVGIVGIHQPVTASVLSLDEINNSKNPEFYILQIVESVKFGNKFSREEIDKYCSLVSPKLSLDFALEIFQSLFQFSEDPFPSLMGLKLLKEFLKVERTLEKSFIAQIEVYLSGCCNFSDGFSYEISKVAVEIYQTQYLKDAPKFLKGGLRSIAQDARSHHFNKYLKHNYSKETLFEIFELIQLSFLPKELAQNTHFTYQLIIYTVWVIKESEKFNDIIHFLMSLYRCGTGEEESNLADKFYQYAPKELYPKIEKAISESAQYSFKIYGMLDEAKKIEGIRSPIEYGRRIKALSSSAVRILLVKPKNYLFKSIERKTTAKRFSCLTQDKFLTAIPTYDLFGQIPYPRIFSAVDIFVEKGLLTEEELGKDSSQAK